MSQLPTRRGNRWAERTVAELAGVTREMALQEHWARPERGLLQRRDARAKWLAALALLVTIGLIHNIVPILLGAVSVLIFAAISGISPWLLLRRAAPLGLPLLVLIALTAAIPASGGAMGALRLALRASTSLLVTLVLVLTTRWTDLMNGLRGLGIPSLFVTVLQQTRQHLVALPLTAEEMFQARRARTVGFAPAGEARLFVGYSMGALLGKTQSAAEATHAAMLARGYGRSDHAPFKNSEARTGWDRADSLLLLGAALLSAALLGWNHLHGL